MRTWVCYVIMCISDRGPYTYNNGPSIPPKSVSCLTWQSFWGVLMGHDFFPCGQALFPEYSMSCDILQRWGRWFISLISLRLMQIRATSHTRLRARDHYTSRTLIGGKAGAGPSSLLHTMVEGPTEYVNARWMYSLHGFLHGIEWIMFHGHLDYSQKPLLGGKPNTKLGDHGILNTCNCWFILFYHARGPAWIDIRWNSIWLRARWHMISHYTRGSVTTLHDFGGVLGRALDTIFWVLLGSGVKRP